MHKLGAWGVLLLLLLLLLLGSATISVQLGEGHAPAPLLNASGMAAELDRDGLGAGRAANPTARVALALASAALRALASTSSAAHASSDELRSSLADVVAGLLRKDGWLDSLMEEPSVVASVERELRGVQCTVRGVVESSTIATASSSRSPMTREGQPRWRPENQTKAAGTATGQMKTVGVVSVGHAQHAHHTDLGRWISRTVAARTVSPSQMAEAGGEIARDEEYERAWPAHPTSALGESSADGAALLATFVRDRTMRDGWESLRGWRNGTDPCGGEGWQGVECGAFNGASRVSVVLLQDLPELQFELSGAISRLNRLAVFGVMGTDMCGTIPLELGELSQLQVLGLSGNPSLSGTIPLELRELSQLHRLALFSNPSLSGTIPLELHELSQLQMLVLSNNPSLSGTIPLELGELSQVQELHLFSNPSLSGTIPLELGELSQLQVLMLPSNPSLSGTIPLELGELSQLQELYLFNNPSLSGTIPLELGELSQLQVLDLHINPSLSGKIPLELGELSQLQVLDLSRISSLSGTIPLELGELSQLQRLSLDSNPSLSGTIPLELGELSQLQELALDSNPSLSGTISLELRKLSQLQRLYMHSNPSLSGTIPLELRELSQLQELHVYNNPSLSGTILLELRELSQLQRLALDSNPSLSGTIPLELGELSQLQRLYLHNNPSLSGTIPSLDGCANLRLVDLHNCSLTQLPAVLPGSVSHLYIQHNPIDAHATNLSALMRSLPDLRMLEAGFTNSHVQLAQYTPTSIGLGPRVSNPSPCHLGALCAFVLQLYDEYDMPMTSGGLIQNLTVGYGNKSATMHDNRDGSFTALIPVEWIHHTGNFLFRFEHNGREFQPMMDGTQTIAVADDCDDDPPHHMYGGPCTGLRTIEYLPRNCPAANHTQPDLQTGGATCVCQHGYEPDGNSTNTSLSCHRSCSRAGESVSRDGGSCICTGNTYNSSAHGILLCSTGGWQMALASPSYQAGAKARFRGSSCLPCPSECVQCEDGVPSVREGWRFNATTALELSTQMRTAANGAAQFVFSCPYSASDCPEISLGRSHSLAPSACLGNHTGALCASCGQGYSRRGSSDNACAPCADVAAYIQSEFGLQPCWFVAMLCLVAVLTSGLLYLLFPQVRELQVEAKANLRILLGSAQVLSLLPTVLELVFPPMPRAALSFVAVLVADLRNVVRFDCWGWTWFDRWLANVFGVPLVGVATVGLYWLWQWNGYRHVDIESRGELQTEARASVLRALAFIAMLFYPQISSSIFGALRCRDLGIDASWLEVDYSVSCLDPRYSHYQAAAYLLVVTVAFGFPMLLLVVLVREWRKTQELWTMHNEHEPGGNDVDGAMMTVEEYHYSRARGRFGFALDDYRPACWWYEPVDLLRKLSLSGLLQFVHRGTAAQCFCGSFIAFCSFGLQQYLRPYRKPESNILKAMVDTQLFLTFLVSFILRVMPQINTSEPFAAEFYGWLLLCSMGALLLGAVALTVHQLRRRGKFRTEMLLSAGGNLDVMPAGALVSGRNRLGLWGGISRESSSGMEGDE
eukprot:COSAG02_NODE_1097_length_14589_cov_6.159075_5_plen_1535_part_00